MNDIKKFVADLGARAQMIANLTMANVIVDVELLTVALAISNLAEIAHTLSFAKEGEVQYVAAHKALDIGWNLSIREALVEKGYFAEGLRGLLDLAETNPVAGSRLMPVFEEAVSIHNELGVSKELKRNLKNFMEKTLETEGFALSHRNEEGKFMVKTADWVNKKVSKASVAKAGMIRKGRGDKND